MEFYYTHRFEEAPNYDYLRGLFSDLFDSLGRVSSKKIACVCFLSQWVIFEPRPLLHCRVDLYMHSIGYVRDYQYDWNVLNYVEKLKVLVHTAYARWAYSYNLFYYYCYYCCCSCYLQCYYQNVLLLSYYSAYTYGRDDNGASHIFFYNFHSIMCTYTPAWQGVIGYCSGRKRKKREGANC